MANLNLHTFYGSYKLELFVELMIDSDACVRVRVHVLHRVLLAQSYIQHGVLVAQSSMHHVAGIMNTTCITWILQFDLLPCVIYYIHKTIQLGKYPTFVESLALEPLSLLVRESESFNARFDAMSSLVAEYARFDGFNGVASIGILKESCPMVIPSFWVTMAFQACSLNVKPV